jgi:CBS domain-containing protein
MAIVYVWIGVLVSEKEATTMTPLTQHSPQVGGLSVGAASRPAPTIEAHATLDEALRVLRDSGSKHVVALAEGGGFAGVLRDRDLIAVWVGDPEVFSATPVWAVLESAQPTVAPSATMHTVACVMRDYRSDVVVVIDQGRTPLGIVTAGDLIAGIADRG